MPGAPEDDGVPTRASSIAQDRGKAEKQEEEEESDAANEDDRLYCVCKTKYDQERCMIACDRCVSGDLGVDQSDLHTLQMRRVVPHAVSRHARESG